MLYLRQSTASQNVLIGPFVDSTDGVTAETALTISNTDIRLSKNGANIVAKNSGGGTHDENGWYQITLDATDTNTVGRLQVHVNESGALPVWAEFHVLEEDIYDALFDASASAFDSNADVTVGSVAANAINAAAIATDAITAAKIAANAIGASELATDAVAEIADAVWDEDATGHQTTGTFGQAIGDPGANTETIYEAVVTDAAGANIAADIIAIDTVVDAVLVDTAEIGAAGAGLSAIPWNAAWDAEVQSEVNDGLVALGLDHLVSTSVIGTDIADDSIIARLASSAATADWDTFVNTTDSLQAIRDRGDAAWAGGGSAPTAAEVADAVWDETQSGHTTAGTFGELATEIAAILVDTGTTLPAQITALNNISAAQVNAELVDVLTVDTQAEPTGVPAADAAIATKLGYLYMGLRNKVTVTASKKTFFDDAGNAEFEKDLSDDGTTYTETEANAP